MRRFWGTQALLLWAAVHLVPALSHLQAQSIPIKSPLDPKTRLQITGTLSPLTPDRSVQPPIPTDNLALPRGHTNDLSGTVVMTFTVDAKGVPKDIQVTASGGDELDKVAKEIAGFMRYTPGSKNGEPIAVAMKATYMFNNKANRPTLISRESLEPPTRSRRIMPPDRTPLPPGVYRVGGDVTSPVPTLQIQPQYTDEARAAHVAGSVLIQAIVGTDGKVTDLKLVRSLGAGLDERSLEAARVWRFQPGAKNGMPVPVEITIEFPFPPQ